MKALNTLLSARLSTRTAAALLSAAALLGTGTALAASPAAAPAPDLAKGQATAAVCSACHTADGSRGSPANPILAGQHPEYLVKQLQEFKAGKRKNAIMAGFAATLSDEDMRNVAAFYASKQAKPGAAKDKDLAALGEKIYRGGIADRNIPACAGCHSPTGAGIPAQYPRVGGQHGDYTEAQLLAFRSGARGNSTQMMQIAAKMNDREIKAVSDYINGLR
ncbi:MAG: cytochrome c4 [Burkholderiales bacterium]|jgi:cytochrome c553|nr:cytochrome c4 [Burkholderiales bacterium]